MYFIAKPIKSGGASQGRVVSKDSIGNQRHAKFNTFVPGSGVGSVSTGNRRARLRRAAPGKTNVCYAFAFPMRAAM
jgi:hypothetical protein